MFELLRQYLVICCRYRLRLIMPHTIWVYFSFS